MMVVRGLEEGEWGFMGVVLEEENVLETDGDDGYKTVGTWDFPGGPVVKKPPCNAGDRFNSWSGN